MDFNRVKSVIDQWDPVDLLSHAPEDEDEKEIIKIITSSSDIITSESLGKIILKVFLESFDEDSIECNLDECICVANKILNA